MWDVLSDDMSLDSSIELALASLDLNELVHELINFDDGDPLERSFSTPHHTTVADFGLDRIYRRMRRMEESSGNGGDFDDSDMEEY